MQEVQRRRIPVTDQEIAEAVREIEQRNDLPPGALSAALRGRAGVEPRVLYDQVRAQIGWTRLLRCQLGAAGRASRRGGGQRVAAPGAGRPAANSWCPRSSSRSTTPRGSRGPALRRGR